MHSKLRPLSTLRSVVAVILRSIVTKGNLKREEMLFSTHVLVDSTKYSLGRILNASLMALQHYELIANTAQVGQPLAHYVCGAENVCQDPRVSLSATLTYMSISRA